MYHHRVVHSSSLEQSSWTLAHLRHGFWNAPISTPVTQAPISYSESWEVLLSGLPMSLLECVHSSSRSPRIIVQNRLEHWQQDQNERRCQDFMIFGEILNCFNFCFQASSIAKMEFLQFFERCLSWGIVYLGVIYIQSLSFLKNCLLGYYLSLRISVLERL